GHVEACLSFARPRPGPGLLPGSRERAKHTGTEAVVIEDGVRRRDGAGPRIGAEEPRRRHAGERLFDRAPLAVGLRRLALLVEEREAQLVAFQLPDVVDAELLRRLRHERPLR